MHPALPLWFVATACCIATAGIATAGPAAGAYHLQMPGDFHGSEPVARHGQRWLALRVDVEGRARLEQVWLRVIAVEDTLLDGPGETSGRRVQDEGAESLAFVRGPALRGGPVDTAQVESLGLAGLPDARIAFAGKDYRLQTECAPFGPASEGAVQPTMSPSCRIVLRRGHAQAVLMEAPATRFQSEDGSVHTSFGNDATPSLLFAGDLDRDGQLDLVFDVTDHYNLQRPTLFLSSPAHSGSATLDPADPDPADADEADEALPLSAVAHYSAVGC